jgi:hypothetical protein
MPARVIGCIVGAVGGLGFVLGNAGAVPGSLVWRIAALLGCVAIAWFVVLRGRAVHHRPPSRTAMQTYGISVTAMVVAIPVGAAILSNALDRPNAVRVWVVLVVGVHFMPFARAFQLPAFRWLTAALVVDSVIGRQPHSGRLDRSRGRVRSAALRCRRGAAEPDGLNG